VEIEAYKKAKSILDVNFFVVETKKKINRNELEGKEQEFFRKAGGTRPDLTLSDIHGQKVVVKDFRRSAPLFSFLIGPILVHREKAALIRLTGVKGVPQFAGGIDRHAFAMSYTPGTSLDKLENVSLSNGFFDKLTEIVDEMHKKGVAHCDLRSRGNVILGEDGLPYVVDFAACVLKGRGLNPFINWLFARFCEADENAILRIKQRLAPELITDDERDILARPNRLERPAEFVGKTIRNITRFLLARSRK